MQCKKILSTAYTYGILFPSTQKYHLHIPGADLGLSGGGGANFKVYQRT